MTKNLFSLISNLSVEKVFGSSDISVSNITDNSAKVSSGSLFIAIKGLRTDAHSLIPEIIGKGAIAIIGEIDPDPKWLEKVSYIKVPDSKEALGIIAANWYDNPSKKLNVIGITGTDGKTTTANVLYHILTCAGKSAGLVSTINAKVGNQEIDTGFHVTNPGPLLLNELLRKMVDNGCEYAVVEVTSHGIDQKRIAGIKFTAAALTNITHEHLDYHKSFDAYRNTKAKLFENVGFAILNADDPSLDFIKSKIKKDAHVIRYGVKNTADYKADNIVIENDVMSFTINQQLYIKTKLIGEYNVSNILAAIAAAKEVAHVSDDDITKALEKLQTPTGRLEKISNDKDLDIYIDFAHTPNSLQKVLTLLKNKTKNNLIVVFGCASERDNEKRPKMAKIATDIADISIFTAEDPRNEDIHDILTDMEKGITNKQAKYFKIPERGEAIFDAINEYAEPGDTIVITGKGHEQSMSYHGVEYPWSDREAVEMALDGSVKEIPWK